MPLVSKSARRVLRHPLAFVLRILRGFAVNQGLLLAGAVAYYALLSVVPLTILSIIALSHFVDQSALLSTLGRYLEWVVPSQSAAVLSDVSDFLAHGSTIGFVLLGTMLFFSSLAFSVLEKALAVIFSHRGAGEKRHFLISTALQYSFVLLLGTALLTVTIVTAVLQSLAHESIQILGHDWSMQGISGLLFYLPGVAAEVLIITLIYLALPFGHMPFRHALIGGIAATAMWELVRHVLVWYFTTLSKASIVYGSLTTAVLALFSMEIIATVLLLGAQVIAEYERIGEE